MSTFLITDKAPYFLTVLFGLLAYQINNTTSYVLETPTISYKIKTIASKTSNQTTTDQLEIELRNLSRKKSFSNIILDIKYKSDLDTPTHVFNPELVPISPATILPDNLVQNRHLTINRYQIPKLLPGGEYLLRLTAVHNASVKEYPKLYLNTTDDVWFTEYNTEVFLASHQILINIILLSMWLVFSIIYLAYLSKSAKKI